MKKLKFTTEKKKAWTAFSRFIRVRDALKTIGNNRQCQCITCPDIRNVGGTGCIQAGHFIPGRGNAVLFDEEQVNGQCYVCNYRLKGNWVEYERVMIARHGKEKVKEMKKKANQKLKYTAQDMVEIRIKYEKKLEELGGFPD